MSKLVLHTCVKYTFVVTKPWLSYKNVNYNFKHRNAYLPSTNQALEGQVKIRTIADQYVVLKKYIYMSFLRDVRTSLLEAWDNGSLTDYQCLTDSLIWIGQKMNIHCRNLSDLT